MALQIVPADDMPDSVSGQAVPADDLPRDAPDETIGRVAGLGARALMQGVGGLVDFLQKPAQRGAQSNRDASGNSANAAGLPEPVTTGERIGSAAVEATPAVAATGGEGLIGTLASGAASQTVKEAGGGRVAQFLAGILAPLSTAGVSAGVRGLVRGGSGAQMAATTTNAAANNVPLTVGQASGNTLVQKIEAASQYFWGGGPLSKMPEKQAAGLSSRVDQIVDSLSEGADVSSAGAGQAINTGVATTRVAMRQAEDAAYGAVEQAIPQGTKIALPNSIKLLESLTKPVYGAEKTSAQLVSPEIEKLWTNLKADLAPGTNTMPYTAVRQLRSMVGNAVDWGFSPANPTANAALKRLYGSLSDDLKDGASAISPQAKAAAGSANALYAANSARREVLNTVVEKAGGPEAVYNAAMAGTKDGATKLASVMSSLPQADGDLVRATVLARMGRAVNSAQNAVGDKVSAETFLTNWNKLSPEAKAVLFGSSSGGSQLRQGLDSLTSTLSTLRASSALKNPSGTGKAIGHAAGLVEVLTSVLHLNVAGVASGVGLAVTNNVLARALTNPKTVAWLARTTRLPASARPAMLAQLSRYAQQSGDSDAANLAAMAGGQQE